MQSEELLEFYEIIEQRGNIGESILDAISEMGDNLRDTELEGVYNDWVEATRVMLKRMASIARTNLLENSEEVLQDTLDNLS